MNHLRGMGVFVQVVEAGSFTGAARRLGAAKSFVSQCVAELERELGVVLLHRTTRRVSLTEAGTRFYDGCVRMLAAAEAAEGAVRDLRAEPSGQLRVSAPAVFGAAHVVPQVARFAAQHPRLQVEVNLEDRLVNLVEEGVDLAIRAGGRQADSTLIARELAPVAMVVCAAPAYLERRGVPEHPAQLSRHDWVLYRPYTTRYRFQGQGRTQTVTVRSRVSTNSGEATMGLLRQGCGLSLVPLWIVREDLAAGRLKVVLSEYRTQRMSIYAMFPEAKHLLPKVRLLVDALAEDFGARDWCTVDPGWTAAA